MKTPPPGGASTKDPAPVTPPTSSATRFNTLAAAMTARKEGEMVVHCGGPPDYTKTWYEVMPLPNRPQWARDIEEASSVYCPACGYSWQVWGSLYDQWREEHEPVCPVCGGFLFSWASQWYPKIPLQFCSK